MVACSVTCAFSADKVCTLGIPPGNCACIIGLNGVMCSASEACDVCVLRVSSVSTTEMPMLEPRLRDRLNMAVPSLRREDFNVAKATRRERHEDHSGTASLRDARPHHGVHVHLQIESRHLPGREGGQRESGTDDEAHIDDIREARDDEHRDQGTQAARRGDQTGRDDRIVHEVLQQRRQQRERRIQQQRRR